MTNKNIEQNEEDKLLIAKINDKISQCKTKNKITYSDFLNMHEKNIVKKSLNIINDINYIFFGGYADAERELFIAIPSKIDQIMLEKNYKNIFKIIQIDLPEELYGNYEHRDYLSAIIKLGVERSKVGDILVTPKGSQIIILKDLESYFLTNLPELTRFSKSTITSHSIDEIIPKEIKFKEISVILSSLRLDKFVAELGKCARNKANDIIQEGRVFINSENELKPSKSIKEKDIITIRGKGKFIFDSVEKTTKNGKFIVKVKKYI